MKSALIVHLQPGSKLYGPYDRSNKFYFLFQGELVVTQIESNLQWTILESTWFGLYDDLNNFRYEYVTSKTNDTIILQFDAVKFYELNPNYSVDIKKIEFL